MLIARSGLVLLAAVACAWFGLGVVQTRAGNDARALLSTRATPKPAVIADALHLLDRAGTLNPDREVLLLRAQAELRVGNNTAARREAESVVRDEAKNIDGWIVLAAAADGRDRALAQFALRRERELAPPVRSSP